MNLQEIIKKGDILIEALPYLRKFSGSTFVIKYGGNAMLNPELKVSVLQDIALMKYVGINVILVHGGGPDIDQNLKKLGITRKKVIDGQRVTDEFSLQVIQQTLIGKTNKEIVSLLNNKGAPSVGLSGIDGEIIVCEKYKEELGYVGKIIKVNTKLLNLLLKAGYIPVVAPIGIDREGQSYNVNADNVAGEVAASMSAEKLVFLTDIRGVKLDGKSDEFVSELSVSEARDLICKGFITGGMIPKVEGCISAIEKGIKAVHIVDGTISHCLLLEFFTCQGIGTMFKA